MPLLLRELRLKLQLWALNRRINALSAELNDLRCHANDLESEKYKLTLTSVDVAGRLKCTRPA
jgi:hypothetical protein